MDLMEIDWESVEWIQLPQTDVLISLIVHSEPRPWHIGIPPQEASSNSKLMEGASSYVHATES
jgi:hypothetical protein